MPEMGGLEAAELIRRDPLLTDQPRIVAVTANAFAEDRVKCIQVTIPHYCIFGIIYCVLIFYCRREWMK